MSNRSPRSQGLLKTVGALLGVGGAFDPEEGEIPESALDKIGSRQFSRGNVVGKNRRHFDRRLNDVGDVDRRDAAGNQFLRMLALADLDDDAADIVAGEGFGEAGLDVRGEIEIPPAVDFRVVGNAAQDATAVGINDVGVEANRTVFRHDQAPSRRAIGSSAGPVPSPQVTAY